MDKDDMDVGKIEFDQGKWFREHRVLNTADVFILARILKRCAKQFISLVDKWEQGEDV